MSDRAALERYVRFVTDEARVAEARVRPPAAHPPVVTISREAGCRAHEIADAVAARMQSRSSATSSPWTVFDRDLVDRVVADHGLPERLARFMPEDRISDVADTLEEFFGLHPPSAMLVRKTAETILRLAEIGNVVIIGRAANIITHELPYAFHVRIVGSFERRVRRVEDARGLSTSVAESDVRRTDASRRNYAQKYYGRRVDDPLLYDLTINTDRLKTDEVAELIVAGVEILRASLDPVRFVPEEPARDTG
jgi:cytidylate kinase